MTDTKGGILTLKRIEITVESEDAEKIKVSFCLGRIALKSVVC